MVAVLHDAIINKSNEYFNLAATTLGAITSASDYQAVLGQLITPFIYAGRERRCANC